jgi:4-amino-4-deoxy-L-arabinose transferase-like glycosyltransferase
MNQTLEEVAQAQPEPVIEAAQKISRTGWLRWAALGGVMLISLFMNFYQLGQNGFGNLYYAAGVRSMLDSWHNFFFVSFDPGGFVTLDKPPLGFWLQVASAKLFGFTPFSVLLPQALAGVISVWLLYVLVRRHFGEVAGLLAALALALSPISVVTNRNNTIDSTLALALLIGAWAVLRAAETGRLRWLLLSAFMVGLGFNIKMLEAYLVVPAFGLLYLLGAPRRFWTRLWHLALAGAVMLALSLSWALTVDLIPAALRPYVGSSQNNSEVSLALGYNGISRLLGMGTGASGRGFSLSSLFDLFSSSSTNGPGGGGGMFNTGTPGLLRLFIEPLGSQIAWLLPLAMLGLIALAWQRRPRLQSDRQQSMILWGMWLLTMGIFFSVASFFHQYYLTEMAPAICALFGIGLVVMWQDYRRPGWRGWLLPIALIATGLEQINLLGSYPTWAAWLDPLIVALCGLAAAALVIARLLPRLEVMTRFARPLVLALSIGVLALLLTPTVWAAIPVLEDVSVQLPVAGPSQTLGGGPGGGGNITNNTADQALIQYLEAHQGKATFLVATLSANTADELILETNRPVMALGGFSGSDPILTVAQLKTLIAQGVVRYFLLNGSQGPQLGGSQTQQPPPDFSPGQGFGPGGPVGDGNPGGFGGGGGPGGGQSTLTSWITQNCTAVLLSASGTAGAGGGQLYYCSATA